MEELKGMHALRPYGDRQIEAWINYTAYNLAPYVGVHVSELVNGNIEIILAAACDLGSDVDGWIIYREKGSGQLWQLYSRYWYDCREKKATKTSVAGLKAEFKRLCAARHGVAYWHRHAIEGFLNELSEGKATGVPEGTVGAN